MLQPKMGYVMLSQIGQFLKLCQIVQHNLLANEIFARGK
jgi:hypothetical protein